MVAVGGRSLAAHQAHNRIEHVRDVDCRSARPLPVIEFAPHGFATEQYRRYRLGTNSRRTQSALAFSGCSLWFFVFHAVSCSASASKSVAIHCWLAGAEFRILSAECSKASAWISATSFAFICGASSPAKPFISAISFTHSVACFISHLLHPRTALSQQHCWKKFRMIWRHA